MIIYEGPLLMRLTRIPPGSTFHGSSVVGFHSSGCFPVIYTTY